MSAKPDPNVIRRLVYSVDPGHRRARLRQAVWAKGEEPYAPPIRSSMSYSEMCTLIGVSHDTFERYEQLGVIPKSTYPGRNRRYWSHQALLLVELFDAMRLDGWPKRMPHFVDSPYWTGFLDRLRSSWEKEHHVRS